MNLILLHPNALVGPLKKSMQTLLFLAVITCSRFSCACR